MTSKSFCYSSWRTETRTITAVSADMKTLTLDSNLLYEHKSETGTYGSAPTIDFSAEVGLLSRTVTISGRRRYVVQDHPIWLGNPWSTKDKAWMNFGLLNAVGYWW